MTEQSKAHEAQSVNAIAQVFVYNGHKVRTAGTATDPLFFAVDVCSILGIENVHHAVSRLDQDEVEYTEWIDEPAGNMQDCCPTAIEPKKALAVTESGLYSLILGSKKPEAKAFKRWVTHEVLPTLRKTGQYSARPMSLAEQCLAQAQALVDMERRQSAIEERAAQIEATTNELEQAVAGLVTATETRRLEAEQIAGYLPAPDVQAPPKTVGQQVVELVRGWEARHGDAYEEGFRLLQKEILYRVAVDLKRRSKNSKRRMTDTIDQSGKAPEIYAVAWELFR